MTRPLTLTTFDKTGALELAGNLRRAARGGGTIIIEAKGLRELAEAVETFEEERLEAEHNAEAFHRKIQQNLIEIAEIAARASDLHRRTWRNFAAQVLILVATVALWVALL